jgi:hypothetical protein
MVSFAREICGHQGFIIRVCDDQQNVGRPIVCEIAIRLQIGCKLCRQPICAKSEYALNNPGVVLAGEMRRADGTQESVKLVPMGAKNA